MSSVVMRVAPFRAEGRLGSALRFAAMPSPVSPRSISISRSVEMGGSAGSWRPRTRQSAVQITTLGAADPSFWLAAPQLTVAIAEPVLDRRPSVAIGLPHLFERFAIVALESAIGDGVVWIDRTRDHP